MKLDDRFDFNTSEGPGLSFEGDVYIGQKCIIEAPVRMLSGYYRIGEIGAFSYFNGNFTAADLKSIGRFSSIAPDVVISDFQHPSSLFTVHNSAFGWPDSDHWYKNFSPLDNKSAEVMERQELSGTLTRNGDTIVGNDVWIGRRAQIKNGVRIGDGAIIGAGAIVTKDVPPYTIVAGIPARVVRERFSSEIIERLLTIKWWEYGPAIFNGCDFSNIDKAISHLEEQSLKLGKAEYPKFIIDPDNKTVERLQKPENTSQPSNSHGIRLERGILGLIREKFRKLQDRIQ